ncbi:hypothetical protein ACU680_11395 [Pseudomonas koreensis]
MSKFFDELMESVQEMDEIVRGERTPSREFHVDALQVKEIRKATGLTQAKFAALIEKMNTHKKAASRGGFLVTTNQSYNFGPAALIASLTSNFLKFSMNRPASALAASS